jgi:hypothetical protein
MRAQEKRRIMGANREYKNTVFTRLFSEPDALLELYNALSGSNYGAEY